MEVCRPMPFHALKRPGVSGLTGKALTGLFSSSK
jgi:putative membrane protein